MEDVITKFVFILSLVQLALLRRWNMARTMENITLWIPVFAESCTEPSPLVRRSSIPTLGYPQGRRKSLVVVHSPLQLGDIEGYQL